MSEFATAEIGTRKAVLVMKTVSFDREPSLDPWDCGFIVSPDGEEYVIGIPANEEPALMSIVILEAREYREGDQYWKVVTGE